MFINLLFWPNTRFAFDSTIFVSVFLFCLCKSFVRLIWQKKKKREATATTTQKKHISEPIYDTSTLKIQPKWSVFVLFYLPLQSCSKQSFAKINCPHIAPGKPLNLFIVCLSFFLSIVFLSIVFFIDLQTFLEFSDFFCIFINYQILRGFFWQKTPWSKFTIILIHVQTLPVFFSIIRICMKF